MIAHEVFSPIAGHLPPLTDLTLFGIGEDDNSNESEDFHIKLFSDSPALTSISYEAFLLTPRSPLHWGQLRSIEAICNHQVFRVAPLWTNIERFAFMCCNNEDGHAGDQLAIPNVMHLSIAAEEQCQANFAFRYLTLQQSSSLEIFCIGLFLTWRTWDERHITDFFTRSACTVTSLSLKRVSITDEEFLRFFQLMPMLKSLQLEEKPDKPLAYQPRTITRRFLQRLSIENQDALPSFLPKLTDIGLIIYDEELAEEALPTALLSRRISNNGDGSKQSVDCIKSIDIVFIAECKVALEGLELKLQPLRDNGVWVNLRVAPWAALQDYW
ncbi:hypothetical protein Moror_503 [Moniliophthora roreri MCA 2997]|uniref:Uncharacterized protein n=1 Tax=Moniliophthora roreri (strain MCA 2997) TaxID=1381753 RepID=V2WTB9_MONRO|nr:hypothetical protein Moror_503 [Moniliophthora roreri MCA 2997]